MAFLKFLIEKLELYARINFCFFGACLSSIDRKISVNSDSLALFKSDGDMWVDPSGRHRFF